MASLSAKLTVPRATTRQALAALKRGLRARGWELRRTDPDRSLGEHLWLLLPYLGINCVLDVGAGTGAYGQLLRENGYDGRIVSFEPVPEIYRGLAARSAGDARWRTLQVALGEETATRPINVTRNPSYASFLRPLEATQAAFAACTVERTEEVAVRRLDDHFDDLVAGLDHPRVLLKLTTQGWDPHVLRGARRCLGAVAAIQSELTLHPVYDGAAAFGAAIATLNDAGFAVSGLFDRPHHHGFRLAEVECVTVRAADGIGQISRRW